jgi:hypothetical protein
MKIRWTRNSVRLRITPSELEDLQRGQAVAETLSLPGGNWNATIRPGAPQTSLILEQSTLVLSLAEADLAQLSTPESEGVYFITEGELPLRYFIEKDFPCAHPRAADALEPASETFAPSTDFLERNKQHG